MESSNWKRWVFKPLGLFVLGMRLITTWYISPIWVFCLTYFVGQQHILLSLAYSVIVCIASYKLWEGYDPETDGQITIEELKNPVKDDLFD